MAWIRKKHISSPTTSFYGYATGKSGGVLGLNYDAYAILVFTSEEKAQKRLKRVLRSNLGLEGRIINLTPLVQMGLIPIANLGIS